jgi:hypothetical protein
MLETSKLKKKMLFHVKLEEICLTLQIIRLTLNQKKIVFNGVQRYHKKNKFYEYSEFPVFLYGDI